jgi:hypothetical protein
VNTGDSSRGKHRRLILAVVAAVALAGCTTKWSTGDLLTSSTNGLKPANAAGSLTVGDIDKDLSHYVLFALEGGELKADQGDNDAIVRGGHIGINKGGFLPSGAPRLRLCESDKTTTMDERSQVVAATASLGSRCLLWDVFTESGLPAGGNPTVHTFTQLAPGSFTKAWPGSPYRQLFADNNNDGTQANDELPPIPAKRSYCDTDANFSQQANLAPPYNQPFPANQMTIMPPGRVGWGAVNFQGANAYRGTDGYTEVWLADNTTYFFCNVKLAREKVWVHTGPNTTVIIDKNFDLGNGNRWGDPSSQDAKFVVLGDTVNFAKNTDFYGSVWAPNAQLRLGNNNNLFGRFWGKTFQSDFNIRINEGDGTQPTTTTSTTTTTIGNSTNPTIPPTSPTIPPTSPTVPPTDPTIPPTSPTVPPTDPTIPPTSPTVPPTDPPTLPPENESTVPPTAPPPTLGPTLAPE